MGEKDPLKKMFKSLPEIAPSANLRRRIMQGIAEGSAESPIWLFRPAFVMASFLIMALLGVSVSLSILGGQVQKREDSPVLRWARAGSEFAQKGGSVL